MSTILKDLSNKLTRLEMEGSNPLKYHQGEVPRNPNQYRSPFNHKSCIEKG